MHNGNQTATLLAFMQQTMPQARWHDLGDSRPLMPAQQTGWQVNQLGIFRDMATKVLQGTLSPYLMNPEMPNPFDPSKKYLGIVQLTSDIEIHYRVYETVSRQRLGDQQFLQGTTLIPNAGVLFAPLPDHGANVMEAVPVKGASAQWFYNVHEPIFAFGQALTEKNLQTLAPSVRWLGSMDRFRTVPVPRRRVAVVK